MNLKHNQSYDPRAAAVTMRSASAQSMIHAKQPGLRQYIRPLIWRSPYLYWLVGLMRQKKNIFSRRFDLLIDGYPRSANTFCVIAFRQAQQYPIRVSSHHHNPAAVVASIKMHKPVLVLIRDPIDAVASWTVFSGYPARYNLETYINYYSGLLRYRNDFCVGEFNAVTTAFPKVISRLNARFGTTFNDVVNAAGPQAVFAEIEQAYAASNGYIDENRVSRPSTDRQARAAVIREQLTGAALRSITKRAQGLFDELCITPGL